MRHSIKPTSLRRRGHPPVRGEPPVACDSPAAEPALPFVPAPNRDPPRTDIERVDERRIGDIEAPPHPAPEDAITGFVEPAAGDDLQLPGT